MPDCGSAACNCAFEVGPGLQLSGSGALSNPFRIELSGTIEDSLTVEDSTTIDLILGGGGSPTDPYRLSAQAKVRVQDLTDVIDPEGSPSAGDSIIWVVDGVAAPRFEFRPPPPNPAGAVNIAAGLVGNGTVGSPLGPSVVNPAATGSTSGLEVYIDTAGKLRVTAPGVSAVEWSAVQNKPTLFPTDSTNFSGVLAAAKGGTGQNDLSLVTVGNALKVGGVKIWVQSAQPTGATANDLWFWG
jgi:hypothetical protein